MNVNYATFRKCLIVEQFQENYLKIDFSSESFISKANILICTQDKEDIFKKRNQLLAKDSVLWKLITRARD